MRRITRKQLIGLVILAVLAAAAIITRLLIYRGSDDSLIWSWPESGIAELRRTSIAVAAIAGVSLAVSGVLLQALLRNPLASPFILGISSGAALGVMTAVYVGHLMGRSAAGGGAHPLPALAGALTALCIVYLLGQRRGWLDPLSLVLVGVVVSAICGALIMFLQHLAPHGLRSDLVTWMMGYIHPDVPAALLIATGATALLGLAAGMALGRAMDAGTLEDDEARSIGLAIGPLRLVMFLLAGVLTSAAVALAGPIGFVGLIAPHAARLLLGPRHAVLVAGAALVGVVLLVGGDATCQVINVSGGRMPVGVFTALVGGPAFIWLLRSGRGRA
ncbi:MAG: iron ABC transporter permease [Phycisphaerales bacterium]|nr:MAG: iron ABC transporter permease [Phycisphaerales bacterium]